MKIIDTETQFTTTAVPLPNSNLFKLAALSVPNPANASKVVVKAFANFNISNDAPSCNLRLYRFNPDGSNTSLSPDWPYQQQPSLQNQYTGVCVWTDTPGAASYELWAIINTGASSGDQCNFSYLEAMFLG